MFVQINKSYVQYIPRVATVNISQTEKKKLISEALTG